MMPNYFLDLFPRADKEVVYRKKRTENRYPYVQMHLSAFSNLSVGSVELQL